MGISYVVLGGGIAGVQCTEELARICPLDEITLVSPTRSLKGVGEVKKVTAIAETFKIVEKSLDALPYANVKTLRDVASRLDVNKKQVTLASGKTLNFDKLCICTGASPKKAVQHKRCIVLRDQDSIVDLQEQLKNTRRILLLGNGGIALELVHALTGTKIIWAVKHKAVGDAFFDYDAAEFLKSELDKRGNYAENCTQSDFGHMDDGSNSEKASSSSSQSHIQDIEHNVLEEAVRYGHAVGPQWVQSLKRGKGRGNVQLETNCELDSVEDSTEEAQEGRLKVHLTNGSTHSVDLIISATGVQPNTSWLENRLTLDPDEKGVLVNRNLESSQPGIFAAGDVCSLNEDGQSFHFFQMRLWTQAKFMGTYAAQCMAGCQDETGLSFSFEIFTHVTRFLGKKVVLLGLYNGQKVSEDDQKDLVSYSRSTKGVDSVFIRVLMLKGTMIGAVLIGETEMEEAFQNLILDQLDLSDLGPSILDPDTEVDQVFD